MPRTVIFGNSGSGKSTYAKAQAARIGCPHLDLDTIAWLPDITPPTRRPIDDSRADLLAFTDANDDWVIEGCYADLLELALPHATEIVYLNPGTATCIDNARRRPWEPHKYPTPEQQDANLPMLIDWIKAYDHRTDTFSARAHRQLYDRFPGPKREFRSNDRPL